MLNQQNKFINVEAFFNIIIKVNKGKKIGNVFPYLLKIMDEEGKVFKTQKELATKLGVTIDVVNRAMRILVKENIVKKTRYGYNLNAI